MLATADEDHTPLPQPRGQEAIEALQKQLYGDLWPIDDAARVLQMDRSTIYRLEERGELAITRLKNRSYVSEQHMQQYIQNAKDAAAKARAKKARSKTPARRARRPQQTEGSSE